MLINGEPVLTTYIDSIVDQLSKLPSGVKKTGVREERVEHGYPLSQFHTNAVKYIGEGKRTQDVKQFDRAFTHVNAGLNTAIKMGNIGAIAHFSYMTAEVLLLRGDQDGAIPFYLDAMKTARSAGLRSLATNCAGCAYKLYLMNKGHRCNHFADVQDELTLCKETIAGVIAKGRAYEAIDDDAYLIAQKEYGISNHERIGTLGVGDCGVLTLHDPKTHWTSLAHIDRFVLSENITAMLEGQIDGPSMPLLTARLCGMGVYDDIVLNGSGYHNLTKIIEFLLPRNINVVSAEILKPDSPETYVTDPLSGGMTEAIGQKRWPHIALRSAASGFGEQGEYLSKAFNLITSKKILPVYLTSQQAFGLVVHSEQNDERSLYDEYMQLNPSYAYPHGAYAVHEQQTAYMANERASQAIIEDVDRVIGKMLDLGSTIDPSHQRELYKTIRQTSKFVGEGADQENKMKADFISSEIMQSSQRNGFIKLNFDRIAKFNFA